jgi:hypothetical protein
LAAQQGKVRGSACCITAVDNVVMEAATFINGGRSATATQELAISISRSRISVVGQPSEADALPGVIHFKPDNVREKIRAAQLINRLQACAFGEIELTMSQVPAIEILLRKSVPDLTKTEVQADATHRYVAQLPDVLSREEWLAKYGEGKTTLQ